MSARFTHPYAEALLDALPPGADIEKLLAGLTAVASALASSRTLRLALSNPAVAKPIREKILTDLASAAGLDAVAGRFLSVVARHRRILKLQEIVSAVAQMCDAREGVVPVVVTAAAPVSRDEESRLTDALARRIGKKVRASFRVDPELLAGFVVHVDSEVLDASAAGAIERFKDESYGN